MTLGEKELTLKPVAQAYFQLIVPRKLLNGEYGQKTCELKCFCLYVFTVYVKCFYGVVTRFDTFYSFFILGKVLRKTSQISLVILSEFKHMD